MKIIRATSVVGMGHWIAAQGFRVGEGPGPFGPISSTAHTATSLHYKDQALDVNYDTGRWANETLALKWLYGRLLRFWRNHPNWPLDEMFFNGFGAIGAGFTGATGPMKEYGPTINHPITGHDTHLHIGWRSKTWERP